MKKYWQQNIEAFGGFYTGKSKEKLIGNPLLTLLYRALVFPIEKRSILKRYRLVTQLIRKHIKPGMTIVDAGCGTGVFTLPLYVRGAKVIALDYTTEALKLTKRHVEDYISKPRNRLTYWLHDVEKVTLPKSDAVLAIGLLPCIDLIAFANNILPTTNMVIFNYMDSTHWINRIRKHLPFLKNIRGENFHNPQALEVIFRRCGFDLIFRARVGTNYIDVIRKK